MDTVIYRGSDGIKIALIEDILKQESIPYMVLSGDMGGLHGALGFTQETLIKTGAEHAQSIRELLQSLGLVD